MKLPRTRSVSYTHLGPAGKAQTGGDGSAAHQVDGDVYKRQLEDLSFFYLEPESYQRIARMVSESREARERFLAETIKEMCIRDSL